MTLSDQLLLVPAGGSECRTASAADCSCRRHRRRRRRRRRHNDVTEKSHATVFCSQQLLRNKITTVFFTFQNFFAANVFLPPWFPFCFDSTTIQFYSLKKLALSSTNQCSCSFVIQSSSYQSNKNKCLRTSVPIFSVATERNQRVRQSARVWRSVAKTNCREKSVDLVLGRVFDCNWMFTWCGGKGLWRRLLRAPVGTSARAFAWRQIPAKRKRAMKVLLLSWQLWGGRTSCRASNQRPWI